MRYICAATLLIFSTSAISGPDLGKGIGICQKIHTLPKAANVIQGCDDKNTMKSCEFIVRSNNDYVVVNVQNGIIFEKSVNFLSNDVSPFGIKKNDSPTIIRQKLKKFGVTKMTLDDEDYKIYSKAGLYLRSNYFNCRNNNYTININYSKKWNIENLTISTLPEV